MKSRWEFMEMSANVNKWVIAAIEAVKWSELADMADPQDVARLCEFFGFNVAYLWITDHPDMYFDGMENGFAMTGPRSGEEAQHAIQHAAVVLSVRGGELV